ncbi:head-tail connector protein [Anaerovoracaceae bacterium 41-7]|uniref:head-tail connector protein n=1 Tax=Emergencia sp. JLR.KK010 TaxID=3114296 RepID=UPI0030CAB9BF
MERLLTVEEVSEYLGIDYVDEMVTANLSRLISTADAYLKSSIGEHYPVADPKAKELGLIIISDLYDNRGINDTVSSNTRKLVNDLSWQLRLELRRG